MILNLNERSWAIDIISEINLICQQKNLIIKKAGGENTLSISKGKSLFPDVLLFADKQGVSVIQGWELKMPDTPITDQQLITNAEIKARRLNLASFLLWNVKEAVIYVLDSISDKYYPTKNWVIPIIQTRNDVSQYATEWKSLLSLILNELNTLLDEHNITTASIDQVIGSNLYSDIIEKFHILQADELKENIQKRSDQEIMAKEWFEQNKMEFPDLSVYQALAQVNIVNWLNRFTFAHYLKTFNEKASLVESINESYSVDQAIDIFQEITNSCDFMNVFKPVIGIEYVHDQLWSTLLEFNKLFSNFKINEIDPSLLHKVIDNALNYSRKKIAGQFSTPPLLARYLAEITIQNREEHILDTCCGTGTIAKSIFQLKKDKGLNVEDALKTVWACDKFAFPLQLCSIAMSDPLGMGQIIQVFQYDVLSLKPGLNIEFTDPYTGEISNRSLPKMHAIVSNLPFVRFESIKSANPEIKDIDLLLEQEKISISKKSDLYAYITLILGRLLKDNGRIGLILSNSWLGADWGIGFRNALLQNYNILKVIISANGKWFTNADVVTTILILEKKNIQKKSIKKIEFLTTLKKIEDWTPNILDEMIISTLGTTQNNLLSKHSYTENTINKIVSNGLGWSVLFVNCNWVENISEKMIPISDIIEVKRGERRGWDPMFFPQKGHSIESEYIKPVVKSSREFKDNTLIVEPQGEAFCCSDDYTTLINKGNVGTLRWIEIFSKKVNKIGRPLPEVLARSGYHWYEMKASSLADLVISMNPDKKICVYRLKNRAFVNQRLISLCFKEDTRSLGDIVHALLNSAIAMFWIEGIGFGRGLGALDINTGKIANQMKILDPTLLSASQISDILHAFNPIVNRMPMDLEKELIQEDRKFFDETIINAFDLNVSIQEIYESLLGLYSIRQAVKH